MGRDLLSTLLVAKMNTEHRDRRVCADSPRRPRDGRNVLRVDGDGERKLARLAVEVVRETGQDALEPPLGRRSR